MPDFNLNDVITDRIDKKVNYGMARTDYSPPVAPTSESRLSLIPNPTHNLWINSDNIPGTAPTTNTADVGVYKYKSGETLGSGVGDIHGVIEMTRDTGVPNQRTWLACSTVDNDGTILKDWIRFTYGGQYSVRFGFAYAGYGNGNIDISSKSEWVELYPDAGGKEWYFDYEGGVWTMFGTPGTGQGSPVPDSKLTEGGAGNYTWSVYMMRGYRYIGTTGLKNYASGGSSALEILDESTVLSTGATKLTFTGSGVIATVPDPVAPDEILVTIPGGGGGGISIGLAIALG
jgi:hypothetical protein